MNEQISIDQNRLIDLEGQLAAISKAQAVIEFQPDGTIITANDNFCHAVGYSVNEIVGKHHRIFVPGELANSTEYQQFWTKLGNGEFDAGQYLRLTKDGREVWLQASYNPILDPQGKVIKVVKYATDITQDKLQAADYSGQLAAIGKAQAVIEFEPDGTIITANDNFCHAVGYSLEEIVGKHHQIFVPNEISNGAEYQQFWSKLGNGEFDAGQYLRLTKDGQEIWLQASYNPIFDPQGRVFKVVKYATDITESKLREADFSGQLAAISKAQAVIEFEPDGTIITANDNFCNAVGYALEEIAGKHHRMFVPPEIASGAEYQQFWGRLGNGEFDAGQYQRLTKEGRTIWLQASYNPIFNPQGEVFKVVKYASDITAETEAAQELERVMDSASVCIGAMAEGDLTRQMDGEYSEDFKALQKSLNGCITNLQQMVNEIRESAENIKSSAGEISQGNTDLSQRTEEQASSLEETASSMEQLTGTVKQNADNARHANQLANSARESAEKGGSVVGRAISAMTEISSSSKKIADIIGTIDEIAFQTNLLALNAAVEAARAGEQGRGFAVVAAEVRNLAQRSAGAAKEIKSLINDSVQKVEDGSRLVDESGNTLGEIVNGVKKVSDIIAEIAAASQEQSSGIDQINKAVTQMDQVTQQNAALVEEAAAASESMDEQSRGLTRLMEFFNTGMAVNVAAPAASPAAAPQPQEAAPPPPAPATAASASPAMATSSDVDDSDWEEF